MGGQFPPPNGAIGEVGSTLVGAIPAGGQQQQQLPSFDVTILDEKVGKETPVEVASNGNGLKGLDVGLGPGMMHDDANALAQQFFLNI